MSKVSITNQALNRLNVSQILSLTDNSKQARAMNLVFDRVYEEALTIRNWNFATTRTQLGRLTAQPNSGYDYQYQLPTDCLRIIKVVSTSLYEIEYKVEGTALLTDETEVYVVYVKRILDFGTLPPIFTSYLILALANEVCFGLTGNVSLQDRLVSEMMDKLEKAKKADSTEGAPKSKVNSTVINRRYGYRR